MEFTFSYWEIKKVTQRIAFQEWVPQGKNQWAFILDQTDTRSTSIVTQSIWILQLGIDSPNFDSEISMTAWLHDSVNYLSSSLWNNSTQYS